MENGMLNLLQALLGCPMRTGKAHAVVEDTNGGSKGFVTQAHDRCRTSWLRLARQLPHPKSAGCLWVTKAIDTARVQAEKAGPFESN